MPHAVEMPSFLSDDTGPSLSANGPLFELPHHPGPSYEKVNGNPKSASHTSMKGSVGESSDPYVDGGSSNRPQMNGDLLPDGGLSSMANGRLSASSWDHKSSRNGSSLSVNGGINGVSENGRRSPASALQNGLPRLSIGDRNSVASTNGNTQNTPIESAPKPSTNGDSESSKRISIPLPVSINPQSTGPLTYASSLLPATPLVPETPSRAATTSPHRLSSPPSYPAPSTSSPSSSLNPHPGAAQLKHRHTLQVPKIVPGRPSRDGDDAMYSSGRFSPTSLAAGVRRGSLTLNRRNTQSIHSNMPHEEIAPDEDAMRWAEAVRQKRASKRRRKDEEDDDRVVVGTKVDQHHVNWVTAYNMLTGIRFTVSRTNAKLDRALTDADFDAKHKFSFDM
jgi:1-phosphatidylinositol-4-phosphate 5-kinase